MPPRTIRPSADTVALAELYVKATQQYDSTPVTEKMLRAVLSGRRLSAAVMLAEDIAPMLTDAEAPYAARLTPIHPRPVEAEDVDPRETQAQFDAKQDLRGTIGTITTKVVMP